MSDPAARSRTERDHGPQPNHEAVAREYAQLAHRYDHRWAHYVDRSTEATLALVDLADARRVLDVGCGTGVALGKLVDRCQPERLVGVDLSPVMLQIARDRLPPSVELIVADVARLPFSDAEFDVVLSTSSLHHWRNVLACLKELVRVCRPGGQVILTDWSRDAWTMCWEDWWHRRTNPSHTRVYTREELSTIMAQVGLVSLEFRPIRINWYWRLMTLAGYRPVLDSSLQPPPS